MEENKYWDTVDPDKVDAPAMKEGEVIDVTKESKAAEVEKKEGGKGEDKKTVPFAKPPKKSHTNEEIDRNKDILSGLGFYKKTNGGEKEQFLTKEGTITVGRTFSKDYPVGKFWAMREGDLPAVEKFLKDKEVKELKVVQAFYAVRDKGESISKYAPKEPVKPQQSMTPTKGVTREIGLRSPVVKGGFYRVRGHEEPDAWMVQQWANQAGINIEVVTAEQTQTEAKAIVRAVKDGQYVDATVIHEFTTTMEVVAFETIDNMIKDRKTPVVGYEDDGKPILSDEAKYAIYKRYIKFKNFSIRDATTKASRIATLKLLNREWREPEEIEAEAAEVRSVNER